jgi:putative addiction module killer protein
MFFGGIRRSIPSYAQGFGGLSSSHSSTAIDRGLLRRRIKIPIDNVYPYGYNVIMIEIRKTEIFANWLDGLHDIRARARILVRIERLAAGNPGDVKPVGEGVSELRIDYGPGYRVYYKKQGQRR